MSTIEIVRRSSKQHRAGQFSIHIDGFDTEYVNDPAQYFKSSLEACIQQGLTIDQATEQAYVLSDKRSQHALQRVIDRINRGSMFPGGMPIKATGLAPEMLPKFGRVLSSRDESIQAYFNRGNFDGLTEEDRMLRLLRRDTKTDHEAAWRQNRKELLAFHQRELEKVQRDLEGAEASQKSKIIRKIRHLQSEIVRLSPSIVSATHGFQYAFGQYLQAGVDFVNDDIRLVLNMTNTTVDTQRDAIDTVSDFTTLDEADGSGYTSGGVSLITPAVNIDDGNDRAEVDSSDITITSFGVCTRSIQGILVILWNTTLNGSMPLHWLEFPVNKTPDGSNFVLQFNAEGFIQAN